MLLMWSRGPPWWDMLLEAAPPVAAEGAVLAARPTLSMRLYVCKSSRAAPLQGPSALERATPWAQT